MYWPAFGAIAACILYLVLCVLEVCRGSICFGSATFYERFDFMRMPREQEDLTGKVCICSAGRIAVVSHQEDITFSTGERAGQSTTCWVGVGFDGRGAWASSNPAVAYENVQQYLQIINERFGGRMSKNA